MRYLAFSVCVLALSVINLEAAVDPLLLGLVPENTKVLVGIDAQRTADSNLAQNFLNRQNVEDKLQDFMEKTGFDPRRDLQYVLVASGGAGISHPNVVVARGQFDIPRLTAAAAVNGGKTVNVSGLDLIEFPSNAGSTGFAFPVEGIVVAGPFDSVKAIVSGRNTPTLLDTALTRLIETVAGNDIWFASVAPLSTFPPSMFTAGPAAPMAQGQVLQSILAESGGVQFGATALFTFDAVTRSPQDANSLADVIRFASNMMQTKMENSPQSATLASAVFQKLQINTSGSKVNVGASVPEPVLEQFMRTPIGTSH